MPKPKKKTRTSRKFKRSAPADRYRCKAEKTRGGRCKNGKVKGSDFCARHGPKGDEYSALGGEVEKARWEEINRLAESFPVGTVSGQRKHLIYILAKIDDFSDDNTGKLLALLKPIVEVHRVLALLNKQDADKKNSDRPINIHFGDGGDLGL